MCVIASGSMAKCLREGPWRRQKNLHMNNRNIECVILAADSIVFTQQIYNNNNTNW